VPCGAVDPLLVLMVAVSVTGWLITEAVGDDERTTAVAPVPTACASADEVLPPKFASPEV